MKTQIAEGFLHSQVTKVPDKPSGLSKHMLVSAGKTRYEFVPVVVPGRQLQTGEVHQLFDQQLGHEASSGLFLQSVLATFSPFWPN